MLKGKRLAVIGVGKIGEALITGLLKQNVVQREDILATVKQESSIQRVRDRLGIETSRENAEAIIDRDLILLCVKPQNMDKVAREIAENIKPSQLVITVAASVSTAFVQERLGKPVPVVRAMPNTPCVLNTGMTALCGGLYARPEHVAAAESIFKCVGQTVFLDESLMDGVTGLSGSGPAYLYVIVESLAEAGVKLGIPRDVSTLLAAQTMLGAARMVLESKAHPALLKDMVTTPAGCTIDGLLELEEGKLRVTLVKAVVKAAERARELVQGS
ncbi:MAG: pyrroline-5-carboxylate reductase [Acidobacteria bacterium]|nr:MAG: pyrroline-5-carboxylate reductase [Acidobacteriota bacterium]